MTIHKEGTATISLIAIFVGVLNIFNFSYLFPVSASCAWGVSIITVAFFLFIVSFFLLKREGLEEYGVAGMLVSIVALTSLLIYYICTK